MEIHLKDAKLMKSIIDPMIPVGEDLYIEVSSDGFRAHCLGIARAWAADAVLNSAKFDSIEAEGMESYYVKLKDFADFMKTVQSNDELTIREDTEKSNLELVLQSDLMTKKIAIRLQSIPDGFKTMDFMNAAGKVPARAEMQADLFSQAVKAAELGGDEVTLTNNTSGLKFESVDTSKSAEAHISYQSEYVKNVQFADDSMDYQSIYKLEYLKHVSKVGKSGDNLNIWMMNNGPLILVYSFLEDADEDEVGYLGFAIAPRVKEN